MKKALSIFTSGRMFLVLCLGFSSGLPLALTGATLQAWLNDAKIDLPTIGRFALVGLPYTLKFLWSPFLDSYAPPALGRRRGWGLLSQAFLALSILGLGFCNPSSHLVLFTLFAFMVAFFSASQDIVLDALRTEILKPEEMGAGAGVYVMGYRLAILVSGAVALGLADHFPWSGVYALMAVLMLLGMAAVLKCPEPQVQVQPAKSMKERVLQPFAEFFSRPGAMEILLFVMVYKMSTMMATSLTTPFLMQLGFSKTEIGAVTKVFGLIATIAGTLVGGAWMIHWGMKRSLWIFGLAQSLAGLSFLLLAEAGKNTVLMITVISVENFMIGLGVAAISGFMMKICSVQFTGTQFALLSSLTAVSRVILVSQAGSIAAWMGWPGFFIFSVTLALPGLLLLSRYDRWQHLPHSETRSPLQVQKKELLKIGIFIGSLIAIASEPLWNFFGCGATGLWAARLGAGGVLVIILISFFGRSQTQNP